MNYFVKRKLKKRMPHATSIRVVWSCSDSVKHEHKTYIGAFLCGWRQRLTKYALDGGTGCAPEAESTPENLSAGEVDPHHRQ